MPQQSLIPRNNNGSPLDRVTVCEGVPSRPKAASTAPVTAYLDDIGELESGSRGHPFAEDRMTLAFQHLDVVLAIAARGSDQGGSAEGKTSLNARCLHAESVQQQDGVGLLVADATSHIEGVRNAPAAGNPEDPVIRRLSDALAATELSDDRHTGVCADALRLAIVTRMLGLQSETQLPGERTDKPSDGCAERQMRALQKWRLKRVVEYVDHHLSGKITLLDLAAVAGLSRMHFASQFRAATGFRPHEYLLRRRIQRAEELLRQSTMTLVEVALTVGFQTQAHFTTVFKRFVGDTPYQWRNAHCSVGRRAK
ncbi:MAG: AraC family transcriptional regulator [Bradyrhizobium sp.]